MKLNKSGYLAGPALGAFCFLGLVTLGGIFHTAVGGSHASKQLNFDVKDVYCKDFNSSCPTPNKVSK